MATAAHDVNVYKSARNIADVSVVAGRGFERLADAAADAVADDAHGARSKIKEQAKAADKRNRGESQAEGRGKCVKTTVAAVDARSKSPNRTQ